MTVATPRREVAELQALVMERRELMARQRASRSESAAARVARSEASRDSSPAVVRKPPPPPPTTDYRPNYEARPSTAPESEPVATPFPTGAEPAATPFPPTQRPATPEPPTAASILRGERSNYRREPPPATEQAASGAGRRADALELQVAQKEAALGRTRIARSARPARGTGAGGERALAE